MRGSRVDPEHTEEVGFQLVGEWLEVYQEELESARKNDFFGLLCLAHFHCDSTLDKWKVIDTWTYGYNP